MIDMPTKYKTRSGLKARVLCVDLCDGNNDTQCPVVAAITMENGLTHLHRFTKHGHCYTGSNHPHDLVPAPEEITVYVNCYRLRDGGVALSTTTTTAYEAMDNADDSAIAVAVPVTFTIAIAEDEAHDELPAPPKEGRKDEEQPR